MEILSFSLRSSAPFSGIFAKAGKTLSLKRPAATSPPLVVLIPDRGPGRQQWEAHKINLRLKQAIRMNLSLSNHRLSFFVHRSSPLFRLSASSFCSPKGTKRLRALPKMPGFCGSARKEFRSRMMTPCQPVSLGRCGNSFLFAPILRPLFRHFR